jgi:hypothetical protein
LFVNGVGSETIIGQYSGNMGIGHAERR